MKLTFEHLDDSAFNLKQQCHLVETKLLIHQGKEYTGMKTTETFVIPNDEIVVMKEKEKIRKEKSKSNNLTEKYMMVKAIT